MSISMSISSRMNKELVEMMEMVRRECIRECGSKYGFDAEEAMSSMGLIEVSVKKKTLVEKVKKVSIPLPYSGECDEENCQALRQNNGLYTQCTVKKAEGSEYCKSCNQQVLKNDGIAEYGTIKDRQACGIFEYVDPKGRKPVAYVKVMRKYKLSEEQVLEEAGKLNMSINKDHFAVPEKTKRGRPAVSEKKEKGAKGRPRKSKKVIEISGEEEDLFATLVASANASEESVEESAAEESGDDSVISDITSSDKKAAKEAEKEAAKAVKEAEKEAAKAAKEAEKKAAKEAEKEAAKAAKEAEKEAAKAAKEAEKKAAKEAEKEAVKAAKEAEKEAAKAAKEAEKKAAKPVKVVKEAAKKESDPEDEVESVKKIKEDGKAYLRSNKTGIIYDYEKYKNDGDQVIIGQWNETTQKIVFKAIIEESDGEESEEEYEEE